jgi:hypothetical protein
MDELDNQQEEQSEAGVDDMVIAALEHALELARGQRAESVMKPPAPAPEEAPPGAEDAQMAELEQLLAEPPEAAPPPLPKKPGEEDDEETE